MKTQIRRVSLATYYFTVKANCFSYINRSPLSRGFLSPNCSPEWEDNTFMESVKQQFLHVMIRPKRLPTQVQNQMCLLGTLCVTAQATHTFSINCRL